MHRYVPPKRYGTVESYNGKVRMITDRVIVLPRVCRQYRSSATLLLSVRTHLIVLNKHGVSISGTAMDIFQVICHSGISTPQGTLPDLPESRIMPLVRRTVYLSTKRAYHLPAGVQVVEPRAGDQVRKVLNVQYLYTGLGRHTTC